MIHCRLHQQSISEVQDDGNPLDKISLYVPTRSWVIHHRGESIDELLPKEPIKRKSDPLRYDPQKHATHATDRRLILQQSAWSTLQPAVRKANRVRAGRHVCIPQTPVRKLHLKIQKLHMRLGVREECDALRSDGTR